MKSDGIKQTLYHKSTGKLMKTLLGPRLDEGDAGRRATTQDDEQTVVTLKSKLFDSSSE